MIIGIGRWGNYFFIYIYEKIADLANK